MVKNLTALLTNSAFSTRLRERKALDSKEIRRSFLGSFSYIVNAGVFSRPSSIKASILPSPAIILYFFSTLKRIGG